MAVTTINLDPYSSIPYLLQTELETVKNILTKSVRDEAEYIYPMTPKTEHKQIMQTTHS